MPRRQLAGMRGIVTGASSGIGRALATALAAKHARLVLVARRAERLYELAQSLCTDDDVKIVCVAGDIASPDVRARAIQAALDRWGGLDFLVNNAGIGAQGRFLNADPDRLRRIFDVNFFALVEMTRAALPQLRAGQSPLIVNVGSILGHRGVPFSSEYCASKFAVRGFSESLRAEVAKLGIDVLVISPGTTDSEFFDRLIEARERPTWPEQRPVPAATVARRAVRAMERGRHEIIPNWRGCLLVWLNRLAPRLVDAWLARYG